MPYRIPEADIDQVKRETDLLALARSRGIELKNHGKDFIGRCPFHQDGDHPNFIVTPDKGLFHCMACGKAGNVIQFVQFHDGVSFRHAYELLRQKSATVFAARPLRHKTSLHKMPCPLDAAADDAALFAQVAAYYHQRLKEMPVARAYLASRGLDSEEMINHFQIGFADRTLGLRMPDKNREEGERMRSRLTQLGLWRDSGHEHFNGCVVVPLHECGPHGPSAGNIVSFYGRRAQAGYVKHLYPPGPHRGLFNRAAFESDEIILCEAVLDALTFWASGFRNVTCLFGTEGFTDELWEAVRKVRRVRIAYDADDAGERAAQRDAERFQAHGIEVYRVKFPHGMDANDYARKVQPAAKSLAVLLNAAQWLGAGTPPLPESSSVTVKDTSAPSLSLAASVSGLEQETAKEKKPQTPPPATADVPVIESIITPPTAAAPASPACLQQRGDGWFLDLEGREYRVGGLEKTVGTDALKVALRLRVPGQGTDLFHLDQLDLCRDMERRRFIDRAAEETRLTSDLLKRDMGRLLLAVEQAQAELSRPQDKLAPAVTLSPEEREAALAWLAAPNLIERLRQAFHQAGIIGEETGTLVAYLAGVSRKLERPLAIIIQSASAAGKTTLMDAVLNFFPEEERVKYSAMTGQSLYYLGETNLKNKILAVVEEAGAEKASYALKLLQSEGELTIASTGKDPQTGKMVTQEYHVEGPVMIFLTTTAIDLDEELQNRCLTLTVDESAEQTGRIHQMQRERRTLAGMIAREERQDLLQLLRNAQRLLSPAEVLNPYAPGLTFPAGRTRNRRDHEKYLTLIDSIALLHQRQRTRGHHIVNGRTVEFIEVTLEDIALANRLAPEVLGRSLDELPPQTRRLLGYVRELVKKKVGAGGRAQAPMGSGTATFSRKELREACGWSLTQVRVHLERLVELECLALRHGRFGSPFVYECLLDVDAPEAAAHIGLIDVEQLKLAYNGRVAGQNGPVAGGGETGPPPANPCPPAVHPEGDGVAESRIRVLAHGHLKNPPS